MTGIDQLGDASPPPPVRSFSGEDFALPRIVVAGGCDLALPTPPALRLPMVLPAPAVTSIEPLPPRPRVQSHFFARPVEVPPPAAEPAGPRLSSVLEDFDFEELRQNTGSAELLDPPPPANKA